MRILKRKSPYQTDSGIYTIIETGHYVISSKIYKYIPTGNFKEVQNEDKYWFEFWKPDMIVQEIYKQIETMEGEEIRLLKAGDQVEGVKFRL